MADSDSGDGATGGSATGAIIGLVLASLIAAGGGVALGWMYFGQPPAAAHGGKGHDGKDADKYADGSRIRELVPITTNLAGEPAVWVRLETSVLLTAAAEPSADDEVMLRNISEDLVAYLRTLSLAQIQGPSGFQNLREDLDERVRIRSEGAAQELIIQAMIIE